MSLETDPREPFDSDQDPACGMVRFTDPDENGVIDEDEDCYDETESDNVLTYEQY